MNKMKKVISVILCLVLVAIIITGCGGGNNASQGQTAQKGGSSSPEVQVTQSATTPNYTSSILEVSFYGSASDIPIVIQNDIVGPELLKKTGVKIKEVLGNNGMTADQRFNLFVQSGDIPDIICGLNPQPLQMCKDNGIIWSLTIDDFKNFAPEIYKRMDPQILSGTIQSDGTFLGVPYGMPLSNYDNNKNPDFALAAADWATSKGGYFYPYVRDDILKQLYPEVKTYDELLAIYKQNGKLTLDDMAVSGLQTADDFIDMLRKIKALGLKQDGKNILPFDSNSSFIEDYWVYGLGTIEGVNPAPAGLTLVNSNTRTYELYYAHPEYKSAYKKWNKVALELFDKNAIVMKTDQFSEKIKRGEYAVVTPGTVTLKDLNDACKTFNRPYKYREVLIPNKLTKDYPGFWPCAAVPASYYFLNKKTLSKENVAKLLNYFNYFLTPEGGDLVSWGPESAGLWTKDAEGKKHFNTKELERSSIYWELNKGEKNTQYYGLVDGNPANQYDGRYYMYYNFENSLYMPRVLAWPLPKTGDISEFYTEMDTVGREVQQWQIDPICQGAIGHTDLDIVNQKYFTSEQKVMTEYLPKLIYAKSDAEFEANYQKGLDILMKDGDFNKVKELTEKYTNEFLTKHPDQLPIPWPVK